LASAEDRVESVWVEGQAKSTQAWGRAKFVRIEGRIESTQTEGLVEQGTNWSSSQVSRSRRLSQVGLIQRFRWVGPNW